MSPVDAAVIRAKLGHMTASLALLESLAGMTLAEYRERAVERHAVERLLQRTIEAALDVNAHIIAEHGHGMPEDYFGTFVKLAEIGVLSPDDARTLAPSTGLRNRLVHEYDAIDDAKVLAAVGTTLALYPRYVRAIEAWLLKAGL